MTALSRGSLIFSAFDQSFLRGNPCPAGGAHGTVLVALFSISLVLTLVRITTDSVAASAMVQRRIQRIHLSVRADRNRRLPAPGAHDAVASATHMSCTCYDGFIMANGTAVADSATYRTVIPRYRQ